MFKKESVFAYTSVLFLCLLWRESKSEWYRGNFYHFFPSSKTRCLAQRKIVYGIRIKIEKSCLLRFVLNQSVSECVLINVTFWQLLLSFWNNVFLSLLLCLTPFGDTQYTPRSSAEIIACGQLILSIVVCRYVLLLRNALGQSLTLFVIQDSEKKTDGYNSPWLPLLHRRTCPPKYIAIEPLECYCSCPVVGYSRR